MMVAMGQLHGWSVDAINLPEHADNPIHTDAGARAAGFPSALVAGVTVYAYLTHPPATGWGLDWVGGGGADVRFVAPVYDGDRVDLRVDGDIDGPSVGTALDSPQRIDAVVGGTLRARCAVSRRAPDLSDLSDVSERAGEALRPVRFVVDESFIRYALRAGDDCPLYASHRVAHPVTWPSVANRVFHRQLVTGPWIHVRSLIAHHSTAALGETIEVVTTVVDRFDSRAGPRAVAHVRIAAAGRPVATIEHEAVIDTG
jgi:acyl dehydratase